MDKDQAVKVIKKFAKALKQEGISVDHIIPYGSYACGRERPDSDIDVAVVSKNFGKDRVEEGMAPFRIAGKIDSRLEPVPISTRVYENDTWIPLVYEIRERGLELFLPRLPDIPVEKKDWISQKANGKGKENKPYPRIA